MHPLCCAVLCYVVVGLTRGGANAPQASFKRFLDLRTSKSERDPSLAFFDTCIEAHLDGTAAETRSTRSYCVVRGCRSHTLLLPSRARQLRRCCCVTWRSLDARLPSHVSVGSKSRARPGEL